ncbi:dipeptidase [Anaerolineales bacterium]
MYSVVDGHNDTLSRLVMIEEETPDAFWERQVSGHVDYERAIEGGLAAAFFAAWVDNPQQDGFSDHSFDRYIQPDGSYTLPLPPPITLAYAQKVIHQLFSKLFRLEAESQGRLSIVRNIEQLEANLKKPGLISAIMHIEGAEAIDEDLHALDVYYQAGLRSLGFVWSRSNIFGEGVPFAFPSSADIGDGLTEAGKKLVKACNRLGILIDVSHLNEKGFWDVVALSDAPIVATHSNAYALTASSRNLNDQQLEAIKKSQGLVGLNFAVLFLHEAGQVASEVDLSNMSKHLKHLIDQVGIDCVGFGTDFDGARISQKIKDVSGLPILIDYLKEDGFSESDLNKITHENWLRVLRATWK